MRRSDATAKFPLENVKDGRSSTVVPASIGVLFAGSLAVDIDKSNDDPRTDTACVEIKSHTGVDQLGSGPPTQATSPSNTTRSPPPGIGSDVNC